MLSCYRASEATDPESFIAEATAVFSRYPEDVVRRVSYGLPSENKWMPSIAEIREACDRAMAPRYAEERRRAERAKTAAVCGRGTPEESLERRKQVAAEMRERLAGLGADPERAAAQLDPRALSGPAKLEALGKLSAKQRELVAEWNASPPKFSPALASHLGIQKERAA